MLLAARRNGVIAGETLRDGAGKHEAAGSGRKAQKDSLCYRSGRNFPTVHLTTHAPPASRSLPSCSAPGRVNRRHRALTPVKMYRGNPPDDGVQLSACTLPSGGRWILFLRPSVSNDDWFSLKLCAEGKADGKANYWLGWQRRQNRFAHSRDIKALEDHRPMLLRWAREVLDADIPKEDRFADYVDAGQFVPDRDFADLLGI